MDLSVVARPQPWSIAVATMSWSKGSPWNPRLRNQGAAATISTDSGSSLMPPSKQRRHQSSTGTANSITPLSDRRATSLNEAGDTASICDSNRSASTSLAVAPRRGSSVRSRISTSVSSRVSANLCPHRVFALVRPPSRTPQQELWTPVFLRSSAECPCHTR